MKKSRISLSIFLFIIPFLFMAQDYMKPLDRVEWVRIITNTKVIVKSYSKAQLLIVAEDHYKIPEKAKNLKLVSGAEDNTGKGCYVYLEGNDLILQNLRNDGEKEIEIYLPASQNISIESDGLNGDISIVGFKGEIEANSKNMGNISIKEVTGPITVNSNTGDIEVSFSKVNQTSPITISTVAGALDITLPKETPANLSLKSMMGEIYTNFQLSIPDRDGLKGISSQNIHGSINTGGVMIKLNSTMGNIYLRKN